MLFILTKPEDSPKDYRQALKALGGVLGHYRQAAASFSRIYREVTRQWCLGMPPELPQDILGELLVLNFLDASLRQLEEPHCTEVVEMILALLCWRQVGAPTFHLSHSVAAGLLLTDPANVSFADVPWPYESFAIDLPYPNSPIQFTDFEGGEQIARTVIVHRYRIPGEEGKASFLQEFSTRANNAMKLAKEQGPDKPTQIHLEGLDVTNEVYGPWRYATLIRVVSESGISVFFRSRWPHQDSEATMKVSEWYKIDESQNFTPMARSDQDAIRAAHRLTVNLCLYLSTLAANRRPVQKRRRGADPKKNEIGYDVYDVPLVDPETGTTIRLDPSMKDAAAAWCKEGRDPKRWSLSSRIAVIGHWKQVPYGPMKPEGATEAPEGWKRPTKRKWIAPYKRGPDATETVAKTYKVGK